jgi:pilus assembly protein FimV
MVRVRNLVLAIAAATALTSEMAYALGLGEVRLTSALNQPLVAEIELLDAKNLAQGEVVPALASQADFNRAGVNREYFLTDLTFTPIMRPGGKSVIRISSSKPVREPYLNFLIEVLWPNGRLLREYTLLLDPPLYSPEIAAAVAPQLPVSAPASRPAAAARPAPSPAPAAPASTAGSTPLSDQYTVTPNDTLWEIADRARQGGSVHQAMLAIQDLNPNAFIGGNINRMKNGQVLQLPTGEQIASRTQAEAIQQVAEQNASWRGGASSPIAGARQLDATQRGAAGAAPSRTEQGDNLRLVAPDSGEAASGSEAGNTGDTQALRDKLALSEESLDSSRRENLDLKDRLNDLQGQLDKLQRLMQLKDDQLAKLQAQLGTDADAEVELAPVEGLDPAAGEVSDASESAAEQDATPVSPAPATDMEPAAAEPQPVEPQVSPVVPVAEEVAVPEEETEGLLDNPIMLGVLGGGALLLLLVGLMALSRRNAMKEAELEDSLLAEQNTNNLFAGEQDFNTADLDEPTQQEAGFAGGAAAPFVGGGNDPLAEADIYVAYGRFNQAAELLQSALNDEPQRSDLRLKLMEVYAELGDRDGFVRQESELRDIGGSTVEIDQLKARYPAMAVTAVAAAGTMTALGDTDLNSLSLDDLEPNDSTSAQVSTQGDDDSFDLSLDDLTLDDEFASAPAPQAEPRSELNDLSFDELSLEASADEPAIDDFSFDLDEPAKATDTSFESELAEFSLDLDDDEPTAAPRNEAFGESTETMPQTTGVDDFDFGLTEPSEPKQMPEAFDLSLGDDDMDEPAAEKTFSSQLEQVEAELEDLSRDLDEPVEHQAATEIPSVAPVEPAAESIDDMGEDFDFLSDTDETSTKLDLAQAYIDMGDAEGARDILDEVITEGSDKQQQEAREMLAKLA